MTTIIPVIIYLLSGFVFGRYIFVDVLGTAKRRKNYDLWTSEYTKAFWLSLLCIVIWPVIYPIHVMLRETPHEKNRRLRREARDLAESMEQLSAQFSDLEKKHGRL